jgi:hypothetical protein
MDNLNDGKLTRKFINLFFLELIRDYLTCKYSYNNVNMATLRKLSYPIEFNDYEDGKFKRISLGTGKYTSIDRAIINKDPKYKLEDLMPFVAHRYIKLDPKLKNVILIPRSCSAESLNNNYKPFGLDLIKTSRNQLPTICLDAIRTLNLDQIHNSKDIARKVTFFNTEIIKRLELLRNNNG